MTRYTFSDEKTELIYSKPYLLSASREYTDRKLGVEMLDDKLDHAHTDCKYILLPKKMRFVYPFFS